MTRRTKRRYAHELHPHPGEGEVRPLTVEVPYLYARAVGLEVWGTGWFDASPELTTSRTMRLISAQHTALLADALLQGLTGDEAWRWATGRMDESGEWVYERAVHHGVNPEQIKPYPCGPEPTTHDHYGDPNAYGGRPVIPVDGPESECPDCTEDTPQEAK